MVNTDAHEASGHIKITRCHMISGIHLHNDACHLMFFPFFLAFKVVIESSEAGGDFVTYKAKVKEVLKKGKSISYMIICVNIL